MQLDLTLLTHSAGLVAIGGSLLYAVGDVLMLAPRAGGRQPGVSPETFAGLEMPARRHRLLADLASLPAWRLVAGGLLGVFATPLTFAGALLIFLALRPAGLWQALVPALLVGYGAVLAPFVHGSFIYLGQQAQAYAAADEAARPAVGRLIRRSLGVLFGSYAVLFVCAIVASLWFSAVVLGGASALPAWMAAASPLLLAVAWLSLARALPRPLADLTQGAGLNISGAAFAALVTALLW